MGSEPTSAEIAWQLARMDEGATEDEARAVLEALAEEPCPIHRQPVERCQPGCPFHL